jgi:hypothetical protein
MDSNQPRGGYFENDLLESEAASALAHLAKVGGRNVEQQGQGATRTALSGASASSASNNSIGCSLSTTSWRVQQNKQTRLELENTTATSAIIKESVLRRLNNPQDIVKRNMFAVEGKSIKFPVKVSGKNIQEKPHQQFLLLLVFSCTDYVVIRLKLSFCNELNPTQPKN